MIPSFDKCLLLMDKYRMLPNIKAHSVMVAKIAHLIARGLRDAGVDISVEKATTGALLHDIGKTESLSSGKDHSEIGRQICIENNLHEIADIVGEHVRMRGYSLNGKFSEKEIVYYADKRVNHDKIVTLDERLAYIIRRYGKNEEEIRRAITINFELSKKVEDKLFRNLAFSPDKLSGLASKEDINE